MNITITHNASEVADALRKAPEIISKEIDGALRRGTAELARAARDKAPKAESELVQSIQPKRISLLEHHVVAAKQYASFIEEGSGPGGWVPLAKMLAWMRRVGVKPANGNDERDTAYLIQRKIVEEGQRAQPYFEPALKENQSRLDGLFRAAVARGIARVAPGRSL